MRWFGRGAQKAPTPPAGTAGELAAGDKPSKRIWVQHVDAELHSLRIRATTAHLRATGVTDLSESAKAALDCELAGTLRLIDRAERAAYRKDAIPGRIVNWWRGTLVESAYRNIHAARVHMVDLYDEADLDVELPGAVARVHATLHRDDPRRVALKDIRSLPTEQRRSWLRMLLADGYDASDSLHARLRGFRNILLMAAAVIMALLTVTAIVVVRAPTTIPLCFQDENNSNLFNCPTRGMTEGGATGGDILVVGLLGLLGGALAASVAIRNLQTIHSAYDVPVALAWLKVPLGAFTAVLGIVAIRGGFIPGLSILDTQDQILAYALLLGFAQQLFTGVLDRKARDLVDELPGKGSQIETKSTATTGATTAATT